MAKTDLETLVVQLSADIKSYERALKRAGGLANSEAAKIESRFQRMARNISLQFSKIGGGLRGIGGGFLAGGIAGLVSAGTISQIRQVVSSIADIGDAAEKAGTDAESLQRLAQVAEKDGVSIDQLTSALAKLNLEVGKARLTGKGKLFELFKANDVKFSDDVIENFKTLSVLFANARNEQDKSIIGAAGLGKAYADLIPVLNKGLDLQKEMAKQRVTSKEDVKTAQRLDDKLVEVSQQIAQVMRPEILKALVEFEKLVTQAILLLETLKQFPGSSFFQLPDLAANTARELSTIRKILGGATESEQATSQINDAQARRIVALERIVELEQQIAQLEVNATRVPDTLADAAQRSLADQRETLALRREELALADQSLADATERLRLASETRAEAEAAVEAAATPPAATVVPGSADALGIGKTTDELVKQKEAYDSLILSLEQARQAEQLALENVDATTQAREAARIELEALQDLERQGVDIAKLTPEQTAAIREKAAALAELKAQQEAATNAERLAADQAQATAEAQRQAAAELAQFAQQLESAFAGALNSFISDLIEGKNAADALRDALKQLAQQLIRMAVNNLVGGLFGSGTAGGGIASIFHKGGVVGKGGQATFADPAKWGGAKRLHDGNLQQGEMRAILKRNEIVLPNARVLKAIANGGTAGGGRSVVQNNTFIAADGPSMARTQNQLAKRAANDLERATRVS